MMNPNGGNNGTTSWLFSSPNPGFHTPDHLHGGHPAGPPQPPPTSAYEDGRGGTPMIPFSQGELSFVDTLTIHPTVNQQAQKNDQGQNQHFVTSSTLHPGSTLSVVEAVEQAGMYFTQCLKILTVFENHRKSLIQYYERSELRLNERFNILANF